MINLGLIEDSFSVLDVGCGLGRLARPLTEFLSKGTYNGLDTTKSSIEWCKSAYKTIPNFHFDFADLFSNDYNPNGKIKACDYIFPYKKDTFDFVWSTSLFTHLVFDDFENYIQQMSRVMKKGARMWNTYLILDEIALSLLDDLNSKNTRHKLPFEVKGGRVRSIENPESQIGLYENLVIDVHEKYGLKIEDIRYGPWSGRKENVRAGGQDVIIAVKK